MITLIKKELSHYFNNPVGYIVVFLFSLLVNFLFLKDIFIVGSASLKPFFSLLPWFLLFFIPAISMKMFAEERKTNTIEILLTLPLTETQIVLAKSIALLVVTGIALLLTIAAPISLFFFSHLYMPEILVGFIGILILSAVFISVSLFFSNKTNNQIVSFVLSLIVLFCFLGISTELFSSFLPKYMQDILMIFGPLNHYESFTKGILDLRSLFYFCGIALICTYATITDLKKKQ